MSNSNRNSYIQQRKKSSDFEKKGSSLSLKQQLIIPGIMFLVCVISLTLVSQLPGIS
jgi:hypothetical protein